MRYFFVGLFGSVAAGLLIFLLLSAGSSISVARGTVAGFEEGLQGWFMLCPRVGKIEALKGDGAHGGAGALLFTYRLEEGLVPAVGTRSLKVRGRHGVRAWIRSGEPSDIALVVEEADGSRYFYAAETAENTWQKVEANFERFTLAEDTADENGVLDPGQLKEVLFVVDLDFLLGLKKGMQRLCLDEVETF